MSHFGHNLVGKWHTNKQMMIMMNSVLSPHCDKSIASVRELLEDLESIQHQPDTEFEENL